MRPGGVELKGGKGGMAGRLRSAGRIAVEAGGGRARGKGGSSLLPVGVVRVGGQVRRGDLVEIVASDGAQRLATGITNYASEDAIRILGCASSDLVDRLGYVGDAELIHRDNMALND